MFDSSALEIGKKNFFDLRNNPYPGRGIIVGLDDTGEYLVQVYWIMGRSANSRNRIFKSTEDGRLYTEPHDPFKAGDTSLIIYNAMRERPGFYVVSNGDQTDTVMEHRAGPFNLNEALWSRRYEPDSPNFTQRITAVSMISHHRPGGLLLLSILRKSQFGDQCDRLLCEYEGTGLARGYGFCITTYEKDGNPLPPFRGDPLLMPLNGDYRDILRTYWGALNEDNRVALAVKWIEIGNGRSDIYIHNLY